MPVSSREIFWILPMNSRYTSGVEAVPWRVLRMDPTLYLRSTTSANGENSVEPGSRSMSALIWPI